ncbi:IS66-like element accessory protein TnpA [Actimicrobium sp. CCI2.3]|uniref:IS66-like element accessory protein TnpA n=1 Tax=Actimicrobium sp. CCI2.3 TaxID=3048616 RepID=UPI002AB368EC|nr:transposase [Actimicrobium sp. CCI2.3]MDY7572995.1 transposase [Actimicrobium sp. CCI2.3]MDY7573315.1 transposase [Actimicrobium sp. CCI2.3]MDY7574213.1 transposase [Actimicrobium sp. CCI2.3]MDY7576659.1 transposase [Actimicrobium sp. CCI2.3]MDY7576705.1 transposase [Actimicrobium sp. CCI2.3]
MNTTIQSGSRKGRRNYPIDFKKQLAIAACAPGVSVARLALDNGINANMLHKWRRAYLASDVGTQETAPSTFMEVHITPTTNAVAPVAEPVSVPVPVDTNAPKAIRGHRQTIQSGVIEISLATTTLRLEGTVDAAILAQVLRHFHP